MRKAGWPVPLCAAAVVLLALGGAQGQESERASPQPDLPASEAPLPQPRPEPEGQDTPERPDASADEDDTEADADIVEEPGEAEPPVASEPPETLPLDVTPAASVEAAHAVEDAIACEAELRERGAQFMVEPSFADEDCGVLRPIALARGSAGVEISPKTQMLCRTALALDVWIADSLMPASERELDGSRPQALRQVSTYVCRERTSESRISEHSRGSAIDIGAVIFEEGRELAVERHPANSPEERFMSAIRDGACGPFRTVLGPGTDADHADHFHFDIAVRGRDSTYCR